MNSKTTTSALAVLLSATLLAGCGGSEASNAAPVQLAGTDIDAICEAGKTEGTVRREATPDQEADWASYGSEFTDLYGIDVQVTGGAAGGGRDLPAKLMPEKQAGRAFSADMFQGRQFETGVLMDDDYTEDIDWVALGFPESMLSTDVDHRGLRTERHPIGIAYNTDKFTEDEIPSTYAELIDPKWAGRISVDPTGSQLGALAMEGGMGLEGAQQWFDEFLEVTKPVVFQGTTTSIQGVATGQFDISTSVTEHNVAGQAEAGLPVAFKFLDYVPMNDLYHYVVADTPRPNAAVCFAAWWSNAEGGTKVLNQIEGVYNDDRHPLTPEASTVVVAQSPEDIDAAQEFADYVSEKLGG